MCIRDSANSVVWKLRVNEYTPPLIFTANKIVEYDTGAHYHLLLSISIHTMSYTIGRWTFRSFLWLVTAADPLLCADDQAVLSNLESCLQMNVQGFWISGVYIGDQGDGFLSSSQHISARCCLFRLQRSSSHLFLSVPTRPVSYTHLMFRQSRRS